MSSLLYRLEYKLETDDWDISFDNPPQVTWDPGPFFLTLARGIVIVEMNEPCASEGEARRRVEPYLRSWEIQTVIARGGGSMRFDFQGARVSDRDTSTWRPLGGIRVSQLAVEVLIGRPPKLEEYPPAPISFYADDDIQLMWERFLGYRKDPTQLASVGYFCLTVAVGRAGDFKSAAALYNTDSSVLKKLGELTSTRGNRSSARKYGTGNFRDHAKSELQWIDTVLLHLIRRVGEVAAGNRPPLRLTMKDLPAI